MELTEKERTNLMNKRFNLILKLRETKEKESEKFNNLGWGYGMRAYSRLKNMNFSKSTEIENKINEIEEKLGWSN